MDREKLYAQRRDTARELLNKADVPALLVTNLKNVRYLTGFSGSNAALLLTTDGKNSSVPMVDTPPRLPTKPPALKFSSNGTQFLLFGKHPMGK